jgi:hypothetical protein
MPTGGNDVIQTCRICPTDTRFTLTFTAHNDRVLEARPELPAVRKAKDEKKNFGRKPSRGQR